MIITGKDLVDLVDALDDRLWAIHQVGWWGKHHPKRVAIQAIRDRAYREMKNERSRNAH